MALAVAVFAGTVSDRSSNRRDFENNGRHILARSKRSGRPVSILMLDVDHFKALNDTYGHDAGDRALCVLADILKSTCRESV